MAVQSGAGAEYADAPALLRRCLAEASADDRQALTVEFDCVLRHHRRMRSARRPPLGLRGRAVVLGVAAFLFFTFGHHLTGGLPRQEVCDDLGCEASVYWLGLLPSPVLVLVAALYGLLTTGAVLGLGLLWRAAR